jgi:hypothetical protein
VNAGEHILVLGLPLCNSGIYKVYLPEVIYSETEILELICFYGAFSYSPKDFQDLDLPISPLVQLVPLSPTGNNSAVCQIKLAC